MTEGQPRIIDYLQRKHCLQLEDIEGGTRCSPSVFMDFPDSWWGSLMPWFFEKRLGWRQALHDHAYRELVFFKGRLES